MREQPKISTVKMIAAFLLIILLILLANNQQRASGAELISADVAKVQVISELFIRYNKSLSRQKITELADLVLRAGEKFRTDPFIIASISVRESGARPEAVSKGGDYGLMQVRWRVHQDSIKRRYPQVKEAADLLRPEVNIFFGTEIFAEYHAKKSDLEGALLRYSAGNKTLAKRVQATLAELRKAYERSQR